MGRFERLCRTPADPTNDNSRSHSLKWVSKWLSRVPNRFEPKLLRVLALTALILSTRLMHHGQTNLPIFHALCVRWTFYIETDVRVAARTEFDVSVLKPGAFGNARRRICVAISSTHRHMMRWTVARQARVRMIGDARNAALFFRARDVAGKAAANVAFHTEPRAMLNVPIGQLTRIVRDARQWSAAFESPRGSATARFEASLLFQ